MVLVMNMSNYETEELENEYGDEIMNTGWNPEVDSMSLELQIVPVSGDTTIPEDLTTVSAELFVKKMYINQR